jgi:hypothetical protein
VEAGTSSSGGSAWATLSERPDGCGVGAGGAADCAGAARRASPQGRCARSAKRDLLCAGHRLPVERPAVGSAAAQTAWDYLDLWEWDGTIDRIHHELYVRCREQAGREASPTTAIIDAQSAKGAVKGGASLIRKGSTRARRSSGASVTCSSTGLACC